MEIRQKKSKETKENLRAGSFGSSSRDTHNNTYELFCGYWKKLMVSTPSTWTPNLLDSEADDAESHLTTNQSEECPWPSLNHYYKASHYLSQAWTHGFEGISPLGPLSLGKASKDILFYFTPFTHTHKKDNVMKIWEKKSRKIRESVLES